MAMDDITKECAFLEDAMNRTVPDGWQKMPENASPSSWLCPRGYTWMTLSPNNSATKAEC